jgi:hypothetical protein
MNDKKKIFLPKLNFQQLTIHILDLILISDGDEAIVNEPKVRVVIYNLILSIIISFILLSFSKTLIIQFYSQSVLAVTIQRWLIVACSVYFISILFLLAYRHYIFLFRTGIDLHFKQIVVFYILSVTFFAYLYMSLFFLSTPLFLYPDPLIVPPAHVSDHGLKGLLLGGDFFLYATCISVSVDYPRISSGSWLISLINVIQKLYSFAMVAIFLSTFIQKTNKRRRE